MGDGLENGFEHREGEDHVDEMEGVEEGREEDAASRAEQVADAIEELTVRQNHAEPQPASITEGMEREDGLSPIVRRVVGGGLILSENGSERLLVHLVLELLARLPSHEFVPVFERERFGTDDDSIEIPTCPPSHASLFPLTT